MKGKKVLTGIVVFLLVIAAVYVGGMAFFASHYTYGTTIGGKDFSFKSKNRVYSEYPSVPIDFVLILAGRDEKNLDIDAKSISSSAEYDLSRLDRYNGNILEGFGWIEKNCHSNVIDVIADISFDEEKLSEIISGSVLCDKATRKEPQNAYIGEYDQKTGKFEIKEGDPGNVLLVDQTVKVIGEALKGVNIGTGSIQIDLNEYDCYKKSIMSVDNIKLNIECEKANNIVNSKITYDWYGNWDVLDSSVIKDWIIIDDNKVSIDEDKVRSYVERSARYFDTYEKELRFRTTSGNIKNIKRGKYGWETDVETEIKELIECLNKGGDQIKEPVHLHEAYAKGSDDIGNSYVEIDLSNQHMYLYINGKCVLDSDFVSGNVSAGHNTPGGVYGVTYKSRNTILRGPGYESFVYYWMPYNGGVGMHDATWRNKFGGEIYKTSGSHGCINLPLSVAKDLYEYVEAGFPVVSYW